MGGGDRGDGGVEAGTGGDGKRAVLDFFPKQIS